MEAFYHVLYFERKKKLFWHFAKIIFFAQVLTKIGAMEVIC